MNGHCPQCGQTYRRSEIGFDWLGRTVLEHRCDPSAVARFQVRHLKQQGVECYCDECGKRFWGTAGKSIRCLDCANAKQKERARLTRDRMRAWRARHRRRCVDCSLFAPQGKKRCRKCARPKRLEVAYGRVA